MSSLDPQEGDARVNIQCTVIRCDQLRRGMWFFSSVEDMTPKRIEQVTHERDRHGRITRVTDEKGGVTVFRPDADDQVEIVD